MPSDAPRTGSANDVVKIGKTCLETVISNDQVEPPCACMEHPTPNLTIKTHPCFKNIVHQIPVQELS